MNKILNGTISEDLPEWHGQHRVRDENDEQDVPEHRCRLIDFQNNAHEA